MPSAETTLHAELVAGLPERVVAYDVLLQVAATFRDERLRHLDEASSAERAVPIGAPAR